MRILFADDIKVVIAAVIAAADMEWRSSGLEVLNQPASTAHVFTG